MDAVDAGAGAGVGVGVGAGAAIGCVLLSSPPPPPQAVSTARQSPEITKFFIFNSLIVLRYKPVGLSRFELTRAVALEDGDQHPGTSIWLVEGANSNKQKTKFRVNDVTDAGCNCLNGHLHVVGATPS